jgi:hypothetical protein
MSKTKILCAAVLVIAACGGKQKTNGGPGPDVDEHGEHAETPPDQSATMIPPEKMDEITQALKRKAMIISRCLATAMENKEVPRGAHGRVTLELVVEPSGSAGDVKVVKSDFHSAPGIEDCVVKHVKDIAFPQIPKRYETSFTYPMEAN